MVTESAFANLLVEKKFVTKTECKMLREKYSDDIFGMVLEIVGQKPNRKYELGRFWGDYIGIVYLDLSKTIIQYKLLERLPEDFVRQNLIMPVYEFGGTITVVTATPKDKALIDKAENYLDAFVSTAFAFPDQIEAALEVAYQSESGLASLLDKTRIMSISTQDGPISAQELKDMSGDQAIIDFTRGLMVLALKQKASDIHIEPGEAEARVRFRIDGVMQEVFHLESALLPPITTRLKVMANCDISERRKPQDGRIQIGLAERAVDCRFCSMPTIYGEKVTMRILGSTDFDAVPSLQQLEFSEENMEHMKRVARAPNGIFFVTGPTGSGKTTTLYSLLQYVSDESVNVMTIEDPVEYRLPGINQVQVNPAAGVTFPVALRSFMRLDPDIILVGEVRDLETAQIATRAALTGHLVLTTLHTNSAVQTIIRMLDMGVEPFFVAPSIVAILAQRLVRRLCKKCRDAYKLTREERDAIFVVDDDTEVTFYRAIGCERCNDIGYTGRLALHEMLMITDEIRSLISDRASPAAIQAAAVRNGMTSLRYDGVKKCLRGLTSLPELDRATLYE